MQTFGRRLVEISQHTLDVVYINTIAWVGDDYEELGSRYRLDRNSPLKPDAIILHPLARGQELPRELDDIVSCLMAKNPDERFAYAQSLVAAIDAVDLRSAPGATLAGVQPPTSPHGKSRSAPRGTYPPAEPSFQAVPTPQSKGKR